MTSPVDIARPDEWEAAFQLVFQDAPEGEQRERVANALRLVQQCELDPQGILVIRKGKQILSSLVCVVLPGATALVWPPRVRQGGPSKFHEQDMLLRQASQWLRQRGARLAQALVSGNEPEVGPALVRNGFAHITTLQFFRHQLVVPIPWLMASERLQFQTYDCTDPAVFHATLDRTYEGTLDFPEINGVRTIEEVIVGHQAQGKYRPQNWWLAWLEGNPAGVMLVADMPDWPAWDLLYLGVVPEARGRGCGREMLHKLFFEAKAAAIQQITVSVDMRNWMAFRLYTTAGFDALEQREVYLAIWRP
jgi:ribosomal protein S18 acetylase RimI-like enzyme